MPNMQAKKTVMKEQPALQRATNFEEVALGYTKQEAKNEALRCLNCKTRPCVDGCPVGVDIPSFISLTAFGDFSGAFVSLSKDNALPAVCGRVCPQENQCEARCVRAIKGEAVAIGRLERFVADYNRRNNSESDTEISHNDMPGSPPLQSEKRVCVIGAGPAGLTCAGELAKKGFAVTIFETLHETGGVLVYGIPEFRLPKSIVKSEIAGLEKLGVVIETNVVVGQTISIEELLSDGFCAVFIGTGAGLPTFMNIEGEMLSGVFSANEYLARVNLMKAFDSNFKTPMYPSKKVAVVGGGNVAMDAARCAKRLKAEVYIIYRRSEEEMPARVEEVHHAREEGIIFKMLSSPTRIIGDDNGFVRAIECTEMTLGKPDESGRSRPVIKPDSEFSIEVDTVIMAIGTSPNPLIRNTTPDIKTDDRGVIIVDKEFKTSMPNVWAGGDAVTGAATVIEAMGAGKAAAASIIFNHG